ncbi:MAG: multifunctional oxoglutarate decarboxylase/oxoglutarate dehydrogenase thiamine pyrophosphate-binding subunit/dihydrolipoyllysine-residue succinyltransferase subunit [Acidimicrobiia bacterium]
MTAADARFANLGPNSGLVEELYRRFLENPDSVAESWREFFADYTPRGNTQTVPAVGAPEGIRQPSSPAAGPVAATAPAAPSAERVATTSAAPHAEPTPLRGAAARIVANMEASLGVPTATSVRTVPAKLLEINRQILNNHLARTRGGKVSFTHLIAYAVIRGLARVPNMNSTFAVADGGPTVTRHGQVNLGLAIDQQRADGSRALLVPNVKGAEGLDFAQFHAAYEELLRRVRANAITPDDFAGTTVSLTNPGMIGTAHSVPRLMPGQGVIVGVGAIDYPPEYQGADDETLARLGVGKVVTLTSTYDHRIIQGAESGEFLAAVHRFLLGDDGFYDDVFRSFGVPYEPARWVRDDAPQRDSLGWAEKAVHVHQLVNMYRLRGHLIADLDPLSRDEPKTHSELDLEHWGLTIWDLDREFPTDGLAGRRTMRLRDILGLLRDAYARTIGVEYMHIQEPDEKAWIQERVEGVGHEFTHEQKMQILLSLNAAEAFERFLHTKYLGQKRFSLEGAETLIPMLSFLYDAAADAGMDDVVMGMAHRGRLNVLATIVGKSYGQIFREFEGELDPDVPAGSGDVKYHLGATGTHTAPSGRSIALALAANPSHLEAVDPVVEGMARAKQDRLGDGTRSRVLPVLVHGDAAFAGQGVVAETLNLSELPGYDVGGTVHIVVNNQLGFTTAPDFARSTVHATDIAKAVQAPIFHVNGDDPEAAVRVVGLAFAFRQQFEKDVVIDLVCYRRYGHNESDEPSFTQPRMYQLIDARRSVRKLYAEALVNRGDLTLEQCEAALDDYRAKLDAAFAETHAGGEGTEWAEHEPAPRRLGPGADTTVSRPVLERIVERLVTFPEGFAVHPKLERILRARRTNFERDEVDWATAEALAFGSLLLEGTPVRVAGQDTRRGTFSQRHATVVDVHDETEYTPLEHLDTQQAPFMIYDSVLSEFAALGFEYGYSVADRDALVCWEAQFGDFANGAQTIIDQFVVAAEDKWGQRSGLTLLLPHGFEGQGPEHSSARLERFLTLCARDNMRVVAPSTAAQYFHVLRRQVVDPSRKPLVVLTPKRYLRMPATASPVADFVAGGFRATIVDDGDRDPGTIRRLLVCSGKIAHELGARRDELDAPVAIVRVEQLYPVPRAEITTAVLRYPMLRQALWVQEEPENMGARVFAMSFTRELVPGSIEVRFVARPASPSPATGSSQVHEHEQGQLLAAAFADVDVDG